MRSAEAAEAPSTPNPLASRAPEIADVFEPDAVNLAGDAPPEEELSQSQPEAQDVLEYGTVDLGTEEDEGGADFLADAAPSDDKPDEPGL